MCTPTDRFESNLISKYLHFIIINNVLIYGVGINKYHPFLLRVYFKEEFSNFLGTDDTDIIINQLLEFISE